MNRWLTFEPRRALVRLLAAAVPLLASAGAAQAAGTEVVFWTADDCDWCTLWKRSDRVAEFEAAAQPLGVRLLTARKSTLAQPVRAFVLPDGLPDVPLDQRPALLPAFDFYCDGKPVKRLFGIGSWDSFWHQTLRQLARDCRSGAGRSTPTQAADGTR